MTKKQELVIFADGAELLCTLMREDKIPVGKKTQVADLAIELHNLAKNRRRELKATPPDPT